MLAPYRPPFSTPCATSLRPPPTINLNWLLRSPRTGVAGKASRQVVLFSSVARSFSLCNNVPFTSTRKALDRRLLAPVATTSTAAVETTSIFSGSLAMLYLPTGSVGVASDCRNNLHTHICLLRREYGLAVIQRMQCCLFS